MQLQEAFPDFQLLKKADFSKVNKNDDFFSRLLSLWNPVPKNNAPGRKKILFVIRGDISGVAAATPQQLQ
jgi:hypothetical protein